jgi:sulfate/thiosulfate transport system ATP-binding protein
MEVADRIVVMNEGRIEQEGSPDQVYDHPATPFVLQFLGDVNLFHGRTGATGHGPGGATSPDDVTYVRPHELEVLGAPAADAWPVTLSQALTVGPQTRLEFKREDGSYVDVELPRARWQQLRDTLGLATGGQAWLQPRRVTRFVAGGGGPIIQDDPAALI